MTRLIFVALLVLVLMPRPALAAEESGTVEVLLVNGTRSGAEVSGQEITYTVFTNGKETAKKKVRTSDRGVFLVEGLSTRPDNSYTVSVSFQEADYESEKFSFSGGAGRKTIKVTVYDATTSDQAIRMETAHVIIFPEDDGLLVKEYAMFNNGSNLTYVGSREIAPDKKETLKFSLPKGATEMEYGLSLMGCCVFPADGGFSDTMAVLPGSRETVLSYIIPYGSETYQLTQKFNYPTGNFDLLIQGDTIGVGGGNLRPEAPVTIEGKQYQRFSLQNLAAGDAVRIDLSGLPQPSRLKTFRWLLWGLSAIAFVGGLVYLTARKRGQARPVPARVTASNDLLREKSRLVADIARLDDSFEAGRIAEDIYNTQRAAKKAQLLKVMRRLKGG